MSPARTLGRTRLLAAAGLSALAGYVDAIAFIYLGGFFVSFMSGNTTQGAVAVMQDGDWAMALAIVGAFVAGVILGTVVGRVPRARSTWILATVAGLLLVGTLLTEAGIPAVIPAVFITAGMGAVNTLFARDGQTLGLTYMTGALVKMSQEIVAAFTGGSRTAWLPHFVLWLAIAAGAVAGAAAYGMLGIRALWVAVAAALVATAIATRDKS